MRRNPRREAVIAKQRRAAQEALEADAQTKAVEIVDLEALRWAMQQEVLDVAARADRSHALLTKTGLGTDVSESKGDRADPKQRWRWAKAAQQRSSQDRRLEQKAHAKECIHTQLRLRGTELKLGQNWEDRRPWAGELLRPESRSVTRHGRLPSVASASSASMPSLIDILSVHRRRSHTPARRNCYVFLPPMQHDHESRTGSRSRARDPAARARRHST